MSTGRVRLALALAVFVLMSYITAKPGVDVSHSVIASVAAPKAIGAALKRLEPRLSESLVTGPVGIKDGRPLAATGLSSEVGPDNQSLQEDDATKTYALVLSSLGILLAIALLRLTRTRSMRSPL
ncbi:hypothetical protein [Rhodoferax sp. U11-2br]|uniref:hypothetical protein n=1 Tax=Rhodoferax sp. U11-2br TaxID=2838878 RepID=UPI001BEBBC44|nr:hypothetical protein [Rhodoferax sp. U11-2br]MBT3068499.1 hypothetical protein [Rhodoferax sp. U11-2br]